MFTLTEALTQTAPKLNWVKRAACQSSYAINTELVTGHTQIWTLPSRLSAVKQKEKKKRKQSIIIVMSVIKEKSKMI